MSSPAGSRHDSERQQGIATAITEVSERAVLLVREEIELAKTEVSEKVTRLAKGAIVGFVAGVFFMTALIFFLFGLAWLLYFELPIGNQFTYFWGFFAMTIILVVLGVIAGLLAYRAVKAGSPPTPAMAIEEARKIRQTVSASGGNGAARPSGADIGPQPPVSSVPLPPPVSSPAAPIPAPASSPSEPSASPGAGDSASAITRDFAAGEGPAGMGGPTHDSDLGRGIGDGSTLGG